MHHYPAVKQSTQSLSPARSVRSPRAIAGNEESLARRRGLPIFLQAKLSISEPHDPYEQEADRVADQVMRMPEPHLQRACACGGECAKCQTAQRDYAASPLHLARSAPPQASSARTPGGVEQSIAAPGAALDTGTRGFMESRFGTDLSAVRVHHDAQAARSAREIGARAYTVGTHIVFGAGEYSPQGSGGRRLLAHELTHVVQQRHAGARIARWKISGNTATSDQEGDVLWNLAKLISGDGEDWSCIWPIAMQSPKAWDDDYWNYIWVGDTFDVSNLKLKTGPSITSSFHLKGDLQALQVLYGGPDPVNLEQEIANSSGSGKTPIASLTITGHTAADEIWGDKSAFSPTGLSPDEPEPTGAGAHMKMGPRRCWFTRSATARIVGCSSETVAKPFAKAFLRVGAQALGTNHWLCGWHQTADAKGPVNRRFVSVEGPPCNWPPTATWLMSAADVNTAAGLWVTIDGKL
jgi:bacterioferritin-associated ferredoxin